MSALFDGAKAAAQQQVRLSDPPYGLHPSVALEGDCRCGRRGHRMRQVGEGR
ncbi:hypothetical protein [Streptomyces sp. CFMR 7]|uniref:hypothetical protein n=1 Tax=Streptomyces sp. CFMR 7 TaxID=1649184 RepID=UPI001C930FAC|nr:hypothetical protein [Streptomyces sp. CFMR 7]